ncbi:MAG: mCpol domain-containing protein [Oscillatoriales cyanobacterium SM2_2_1]|nr:mCpol domain-containing protein [Oscillatoriales cyanobacterium SM2_2_1]
MQELVKNFGVSFQDDDYRIFSVAIDGDLVGRKIEKLIISNKLDELIEYSHVINKSVDSIRLVANSVGGKTYLQGGQSLLVEVKSYQSFIKKLIEIHLGLVATFSVGIGKNIVEAHLVLKFAKSAGRGLIILVEVVNGEFKFRHIT